MSDFKLPENIDDWPKSPFELLGVTGQVSSGDLKRVYTRLIRLYRPERMPEHFRRIREAYETLQQYAAWNDARGVQEAEEPVSSGFSPLPMPRTQEQSSRSQNDADGDAPEDSKQGFSGEWIDTLDQSWRLAIQGELERAYQSLTNQRERRPQQVAIYLRLYWLLLARPELDAGRTPPDWLLQGLASCPQYAPLMELWGEELADSPQLASSTALTSLLESAQGTLLTDLLLRRWQTAARLEWWDIPCADLETFRERVCRHEEVAWLQLLVALTSMCLAADLRDTASILRICHAQFKDLHHLHMANGHLFDRADFLFQIADELSRALANTPEAPNASRWAGVSPEYVLGLVRLFVAGRTDDVAAAAEPLVLRVCRKPREGLALLDQAAALSPKAFTEIGGILDWLAWKNARSENLNYSEEAAKNLIYRLGSRFTGSHAENRLCVLDFCCAESIPPQQVAQEIGQQGEAYLQIAQRIAGDLSLCWTYQFHRLGWLQ